MTTTEAHPHYVHIFSYGADEPVKSLGPYDGRHIAQRAEYGLNRNLDHERFYSVVRPEGGTA